MIGNPGLIKDAPFIGSGIVGLDTANASAVTLPMRQKELRNRIIILSPVLGDDQQPTSCKQNEQGRA
jgi:hypothetical protein